MVTTPRPISPRTETYAVAFAESATGWLGVCPRLGLTAQGRTLALARRNLRDAVTDGTATQKALPTGISADSATGIYAELMEVTIYGSNLTGGSYRAGLLKGAGPYVEDDGTMVLLQSVVLVIDELGTSAATSAKSTSQDLQRRANLLRRASTWLADDSTADIESVSAYTDNILHAAPVFGDPTARLGATVFGAMHYQLDRTLAGTAIRGGIAVGPHHSSEQLITGPALIEAHLIESELAINPRIVLSPKVVALAIQDCMYESDPRNSGFARELLTDGDGQVFVHYLAATDYLDGRRARAGALRAHRNVITRNLGDKFLSARAISKWCWVADYHNYFVTQERYSDSLMVKVDPLGIHRTLFHHSFHPFVSDLLLEVIKGSQISAIAEAASVK